MHVDFIVIGAGSTGSTIAARLSENGGRRVLALEAGGSDKRFAILMPAASFFFAITNPRYDWRYLAEADPTRNDRRDYMPRGKVLGGTSSINGTSYVRGKPSDYDEWAAAGCTGWDFESVLPYFKRSEDNENGSNRYHGVGGPLAVSNLRAPHKLSEDFLQSCVNAGLRRMADINVPPQEGVGYVPLTQRRGWRYSASRAYLWRAMRRANLEVATHAHVQRILFEGRRATGVEFQRGDKIERASASRAVILCAGAFGSPQLLMLSGVGPADHLREMGIAVVHDLPGVGRNMHDHPCISQTCWVNRATYNVQSGPLNALRHGALWLFFGMGPGASPVAQVAGFARCYPDRERPCVQYLFTPAGFTLSEKGPAMFDRPAITGLTNLYRTYSTGWVRLGSNDPHALAIVQPNLLGDERDVDALVAAGRFQRRIFETEPIARAILGEDKPGKEVRSDDEWRAFIRETAAGGYHPAGTCRMGVDALAVVDPSLKVRGLDGLYVADASIMPFLVSANPNATCIMIGEKAADLIQAAP
jgi:choline dehydrogenase